MRIQLPILWNHSRTGTKKISQTFLYFPHLRPDTRGFAPDMKQLHKLICFVANIQYPKIFTNVSVQKPALSEVITNLPILRLDHLGALPCQQGGHCDSLSTSTHFQTSLVPIWKLYFSLQISSAKYLRLPIDLSIWMVLSHGEIKRDYILQI